MYFPYYMGEDVAPPPPPTPEQLECMARAKRMFAISQQVWEAVQAETTFGQWISMSDRALCDKAVEKAWSVFEAGLVR